MPTNWQEQFQQLIDAKDRSGAWSVYMAAWNANVHLSISGDQFETLFATIYIADEAVALMSRDRAFRLHIARIVTRFPAIDLSDSSVCRVYAAASDGDTMIQQWIQRLRVPLSASEKADLAESCIEALVDQHGRDWMRARLPSLWAEQDLLEEEREAIIIRLGEGGVLTRELLQRLGQQAEVLAERLHQLGRLNLPCRIRGSVPPIVLGQRSSEQARRRVASLLEEVSLNADLRDAGILSPKQNRRWEWSHLTDRPDFDHLVHALHRFGNLSRSEAEAYALAMLSPRHPLQETVTSLSFPIIRLLHLQQILSAPSLASALARPEQFLLPEVFLFVLGQKGANYIPELRLDSNTDRRWRARWAETTAEAVAVIFMEEAVAMDLSSLARIPETSKGPTPDFQAGTATKTPIVFEVKGATNWETHRRQRNEARAQLGKAPPTPPEGAGPGFSWNLGAQAFACCLFASEQGSQKSSLFHVADPPFPFADLFREGWEDRARRHHCAAVLEACEQHALADYLLRRRREEMPRQELERLTLPFGAEGLNFVGRYDPLDAVARRIGHPSPELFRGIRVFRGLDAELLSALERSESALPPPPPSTAFPTGAVAGEQGGARGVYSRLSDGAFLAVIAE